MILIYMAAMRRMNYICSSLRITLNTINIEHFVGPQTSKFSWGTLAYSIAHTIVH